MAPRHILTPEHSEYIIQSGDLDVVHMFMHKFHRDAAIAWIKINRPQWSRELTDDMLQLCAPTQEQILYTGSATGDYEHYQNSKSVRRLFCASGWLLGASWNQLAALFGVTREAIIASVNRIMPPHTRLTMRQRKAVSYERVSDMYAAFKIILVKLGVDDTLKLNPVNVAGFISASMDRPDTMEDEDTLDIGIQSRIPTNE